MPTSARDQKLLEWSGVEDDRLRIWEVGLSDSDSAVVEDFHRAAIKGVARQRT